MTQKDFLIHENPSILFFCNLVRGKVQMFKEGIREKSGPDRICKLFESWRHINSNAREPQIKPATTIFLKCERIKKATEEIHIAL